jgi:hypothetical protein
MSVGQYQQGWKTIIAAPSSFFWADALGTQTATFGSMDWVRGGAMKSLCIVVLFLFGCQRGPEIVAGTRTDERVEAAGFNGESYRTEDGSSAITLISSTELEYRVNNSTTLLCKYSDKENAIRVILTELGTQQVLYFRRVPNGLMSNSGTLYLNAAGLAELRRQEAISRQQQMDAEAAARAVRVENERQQAVAAQRELQEQQRKDHDNSGLLIGTWRDENSLCTYSTDGLRAVRADDGTTLKGRWSVSNGRIVGEWSERNGSPSNIAFNEQIIELTSSSMTVKDAGGSTWHSGRVK